MTKRFVIILLDIALLSLCLFAEDTKPSFDIGPFAGFAGIPIGNNNFKGGDDWSQPANVIDKYDDTEMIAMVKISDVDPSYSKSTFTISVSCPNGMYMASLSNPDFKRPFEIYFYPKTYRYSHTDEKGNRVYATDYDSGSIMKLNNSNPVGYFNPNLTTYYNWSQWFDVVLVLPGTVDAENNRLIVEENGQQIIYPLIEAYDYSAIITITVDFDGAKSQGSLTLPFTGYYDGATDSTSKASENPASLAINMYPGASNINLDVSNRGVWIPVCSLSYMYFLGNYSKDYKSTRNAIFLSSSSDPFVAGDKFVLVKDDLSHDTQLTSANSINFGAKLIDLKNGNENSFDGTNSVLSSTEYGSLTSPYVLLNGEVEMVEYGDPHGSKAAVYREYQAEMQVKLDQSDVTLLQGKYEGEIYVHVITE